MLPPAWSYGLVLLPKQKTEVVFCPDEQLTRLCCHLLVGSEVAVAATPTKNTTPGVHDVSEQSAEPERPWLRSCITCGLLPAVTMDLCIAGTSGWSVGAPQHGYCDIAWQEVGKREWGKAENEGGAPAPVLSFLWRQGGSALHPSWGIHGKLPECNDLDVFLQEGLSEALVWRQFAAHKECLLWVRGVGRVSWCLLNHRNGSALGKWKPRHGIAFSQGPQYIWCVMQKDAIYLWDISAHSSACFMPQEPGFHSHSTISAYVWNCRHWLDNIPCLSIKISQCQYMPQTPLLHTCSSSLQFWCPSSCA